MGANPPENMNDDCFLCNRASQVVWDPASLTIMESSEASKISWIAV